MGKLKKKLMKRGGGKQVLKKGKKKLRKELASTASPHKQPAASANGTSDSPTTSPKPDSKTP